MKLLILLSLLTGCAYGVMPDHQEESYAIGPAPGSIGSDAGSSNWGGGNSSNGLPNGCYWEDVIDHNQLVDSFIICIDNPGLTYKWIPDPPPDGNPVLHKKD